MLKALTDSHDEIRNTESDFVFEKSVFTVPTIVAFQRRSLKTRLGLDIANWVPVIIVGALYGVMFIMFLVSTTLAIIESIRCRDFDTLFKSSDRIAFYFYAFLLSLCWFCWQFIGFLYFFASSRIYIVGIVAMGFSSLTLWLFFCNYLRKFFHLAYIIVILVLVPLLLTVFGGICCKYLFSTSIRSVFLRLYDTMYKIYNKPKIIFSFPSIFTVELFLQCIFGIHMVKIWRSSMFGIFKFLVIGTLIGIFPAFLCKKFNSWFKWSEFLLPTYKKAFKSQEQKLLVDWNTISNKQNIKTITLSSNFELSSWIFPFLWCEILFYLLGEKSTISKDDFLNIYWFMGRLFFIICMAYSSVWSNQFVLWQRVSVLLTLRPGTFGSKDNNEAPPMLEDAFTVTLEDLAAVTPLKSDDFV